MSKFTTGERGVVHETWSKLPQGRKVMIEEDVHVHIEDKDDSLL